VEITILNQSINLSKEEKLGFSSIVVLVFIMISAVLQDQLWLLVICMIEVLVLLLIIQNKRTLKITISKNALALQFDKRNLDNHYVVFIELANLTTYSQHYDITLGDQILKQAYFLLKKQFGRKVYIYGTNQIIVIQEFKNKTVINNDMRYTEQHETAGKIKRYLRNHAFYSPASNETYDISLAIGVSSFGTYCENKDINSLIKLAHFTMLKSKDIKKDVLVANNELRLIKQDLDSFNLEIEKGFKLDEFSPYFLPIIDTTTLKIIGCESLVRWQKNKYRIIEASKFKDIAIEKNLFEKIDKRVIEKTFIAYKEWMTNGLISKDFIVVINLSFISLLKLKPIELVKLADTYQLVPSNIEFDISEDYEITEKAVNAIKKLKEVGFNVSIDAFGNQNFSIQSISKLPLSTIKLDKVNLPKDRPSDEEFKIYETLVSLSRILDTKVLSKGVENKHHLKMARELHVDFVQGYYFTPPLDLSKISIFLNKYKDGIPA